jgi:hypothetical protein
MPRKPTDNKKMGKKPNRSAIFAFRLTEKDAKALEDRMQLAPVIDIASKEQFARKVVLDFLHNRLIYLNPHDQKINPELELAL